MNTHRVFFSFFRTNPRVLICVVFALAWTRQSHIYFIFLHAFFFVHYNNRLHLRVGKSFNFQCTIASPTCVIHGFLHFFFPLSIDPIPTTLLIEKAN